MFGEATELNLIVTAYNHYSQVAGLEPTDNFLSAQVAVPRKKRSRKARQIASTRPFWGVDYTPFRQSTAPKALFRTTASALTAPG